MKKTMNSKPKIKKTVNPHDMFFKGFYSKPDFALELFQLIFSKEELKACDWQNLKAEKDSLKEKRADLVFSVPLKTNPKTKVKIFILLEHKSYYDPDFFSQCLYYQTMLHEISLEASGTASPIITVLVSQGKTRWKGPKTFQEASYKGFLDKIPAEFKKNMLNYGIKLLDVQDPKLKEALKDKKFKSRGPLNLMGEIWHLRHTRDEFKRVLALFSNLPYDSSRHRKIRSVYDYLECVLKEGKKLKKLLKEAEQELIREGTFKEGGDMDIVEYTRQKEMMKGWRKGRKEGLQKGLQKGRQKIILKMLKKKADVKFISEVTGTPVKEIKKLKNGS